MANPDTPNGFKWVKRKGGGTAILDWITLAGTVTKGDALVFSAGTCTIALSNSPLIHGVADSSGVSGDEIPFYPAVDENIFEAQCTGSYSKASHLGVALDITGTTGIQEVNQAASTEKVFLVQELKPGSAEGANARVWGIFPRSSYQGMEDAE
jgi:hypothetical protein